MTWRRKEELILKFTNFFISSLVTAKWSASRPGCFPSGERAPGVHLIGGCVGPHNRSGRRGKEIPCLLHPLETRPLSRPSRCQSLCRVCYPRFLQIWRLHKSTAVSEVRTPSYFPNWGQNFETIFCEFMCTVTDVRKFYFVPDKNPQLPR
jgi:hypothetical protein